MTTKTLAPLGCLLVMVLAVAPLDAREGFVGNYTVVAGDYLSHIAAVFGSSVEDLKEANNLASDLIHPGQQLRVPSPFRRTPAASIRWSRPFSGNRGEVLRPFGQQKNGRLTTRRTGVEIAYPPGSNILAPATGVVRYTGVQKGYGSIIILEHGGDYITVLGPFDPGSLRVATASMVRRGEILGRSGSPAKGDRPYLHIELRRSNEAIDPARLID